MYRSVYWARTVAGPAHLFCQMSGSSANKSANLVSLPRVPIWLKFHSRSLWCASFSSLFYEVMATSHTSLTPWLWRLHTGLRLVQGVACCPVASSHYLKQCWLIISKVLLHSHRKKDIDYLNAFRNYILKFTQASELMILVKSDETMNGNSDDERILTTITMFCPGLPNYSTTTHVMKLLTYCCLVVSYGVIDLCQLWFR